MRDQILTYFRIIPAASAEMVASELGLDPREVQDMLIHMDDDGTLLMKSGWYRLSEMTKRKLEDKNK
jgi:Mn-dependent DtxR family transcriptional regulator